MALQGLRKKATGVLQTITAKDTVAATTSSATWTEIWTGISIERTAPNSKFVIILNVSLGYPNASNTDAYNYAVNIGRDGTALNIGRAEAYFTYSGGSIYGFAGSDAPGYGGGSYSFNYENQYKNLVYTDEPTGAVGTTFRYGVFLANHGGGGTIYYNRSAQTTTNGGITSMMIQEVTA